MIELYGTVFSVILGCLLHFTYEWSGRSLLISLLAPTNESVFEHLKLLLTPFLLWSLYEYVTYGQFMDPFIPAKLLGVLAGMIFIVIMFYSYTAVCGRNYLTADILLFILSVCVSFGLSHYLMILPLPAGLPVRVISIFSLSGLLILFAVFSVFPPNGRLFASPTPKSHSRQSRS